MTGTAVRGQDVGVHEYEYWRLHLSRDVDRNTARAVLTQHAEYGRWELSRLRLYPDGSRRVELRRPVIRVARTG